MGSTPGGDYGGQGVYCSLWELLVGRIVLNKPHKIEIRSITFLKMDESACHYMLILEVFCVPFVLSLRDISPFTTLMFFTLSLRAISPFTILMLS